MNQSNAQLRKSTRERTDRNESSEVLAQRRSRNEATVRFSPFRSPGNSSRNEATVRFGPFGSLGNSSRNGTTVFCNRVAVASKMSRAERLCLQSRNEVLPLGGWGRSPQGQAPGVGVADARGVAPTHAPGASARRASTPATPSAKLSVAISKRTWVHVTKIPPQPPRCSVRSREFFPKRSHRRLRKVGETRLRNEAISDGSRSKERELMLISSGLKGAGR